MTPSRDPTPPHKTTDSLTRQSHRLKLTLQPTVIPFLVPTAKHCRLTRLRVQRHPVDSDFDDAPFEPQDDLSRQSPYGQDTCTFYYDRLDNRPMSAGVNIPQCFRDTSCCAFHGDLDPIRKICSDTRNPTHSTVCSHVGRGAVKDRRVHEMGHFYSFFCLECRGSRRSWSSLVNMPLHKKASGQSESYIRYDRCWDSIFQRISRLAACQITLVTQTYSNWAQVTSRGSKKLCESGD